MSVSVYRKTGILEKEGHLFRNWKKRYFTLSDTHLRYYKSSDEDPLKGEVNLRTILKVVPPEPDSFLFHVRTIRGKDYALRGFNHTDAMEWAEAIHTAHVAPSPMAALQVRVREASDAGQIVDDDRDRIVRLLATGDPDDLAKAKDEFAAAMARAPAATAASSTPGGGKEDEGPHKLAPEFSGTLIAPEHVTSGVFGGLPTLFEDDYKLGDKLGEGGYSVVYSAEERKTGEVVAVKVIAKSNLDAAGLRALRQEVHVMNQLNHPNIVAMKAFYNEPTTFFMVQELMSGGELFDQIVQRTHYSEREARDVVLTLASALAYMHSKNIAHRDLKPENILLTSKTPAAEIKLADLGFAREAHAGLSTRCGTPSYVAPEILSGVKYGVEVDIWGLGVIMYILLCGYAPFANSSQPKLFAAIRQGRFYFDSPYWDKISPNAKALIRRMLVVDPRARITAAELLTHEWVTGVVGSADLSGVILKIKDFRDEARTIVKEGVLTKQGGLIKSWKSRTFVLTGERLAYHKGHGSSAPRGIIRLRTIKSLAGVKEQPCQFVISTVAGRDYLIQAENEEEKREWMQAINTTRQRFDLILQAQHAMAGFGGMKDAKQLIGLSNDVRAMRESIGVAESPTARSAGDASPLAGAGGDSPTAGVP